MKLRRHSKSSIFLLEILINIIFFAALMCVTLQFFVKSHVLTRDSVNLEKAVTWCNNLGNIYQSGDGSLSIYQDLFSDAYNFESSIIFYLDEDYTLTGNVETSKYQIVVELVDPDACNHLHQASIRFLDYTKNNIYGLNVYYYEKHTPSSLKGGDGNE